MLSVLCLASIFTLLMRRHTVPILYLLAVYPASFKFEIWTWFFGNKKKTKFAHKPSFAWSCDFLVLSIEITMKNYVEWWLQTFKTRDFRRLEKSAPSKIEKLVEQIVCLNDMVIRPTSKSNKTHLRYWFFKAHRLVKVSDFLNGSRVTFSKIVWN